MHICICFLGLVRTFDSVVRELKQSLIEHTNTYTIIYVTWETEDTERFETEFPGATIIKMPIIDMTFPLFQEWKQGLQMHVSWRRTYGHNDRALYRYFLQIYLWHVASTFLKSLPSLSRFDILVRTRTDIVIEGPPLHTFYPFVSMNKKNLLYFPNSPRQGILQDDEGCPDQLFFGSPESVCSCLDIVKYTQKYKKTYVETRERWYSQPTIEENIIQPESTLYSMVVGEGFVPFFLPINVEVRR
jgi:hypothetical protein